VLNSEWYDGKKITEESVLPYLKKDNIVLEIACGIGRVSKYVAPFCKHLICSDIIDQALAEAKTNLKDFNNVSFQ
jgi:ubiquinone/menaquinone biosynthesis C-methylase UbiE